MDTLSPMPSFDSPYSVFSYIVTHDTSFAPNPFFGFCTLACCKPRIRNIAKSGDWIVGLTPKALHHRIVYYMRVDEVLPSFTEYWLDSRFDCKKPIFGDKPERKYGDNIYKLLSSNKYRQLQSMHSRNQRKEEDLQTKSRDLSGRHILVSENFAYFGEKAIPIPDNLNVLIVGRSHKRCSTPETHQALMRLVEENGLRGLYGTPRSWACKGKQTGNCLDCQAVRDS